MAQLTLEDMNRNSLVSGSSQARLPPCVFFEADECSFPPSSRVSRRTFPDHKPGRYIRRRVQIWDSSYTALPTLTQEADTQHLEDEH